MQIISLISMTNFQNPLCYINTHIEVKYRSPKKTKKQKILRIHQTSGQTRYTNYVCHIKNIFIPVFRLSMRHLFIIYLFIYVYVHCFKGVMQKYICECEKYVFYIKESHLNFRFNIQEFWFKKRIIIRVKVHLKG